MNFKSGRVKQRRAGCLLCKPHKASFNKTAARMRERRVWQREVCAALVQGTRFATVERGSIPPTDW